MTGEDQQVKKVTDAQTKITDALKTNYEKQEKLSQIHWMAEAEMPRIAFQNILDNWFKTAQSVTDTVAYAQTIAVTDGKKSVTPMKVDYGKAPVLETADFTSIKFTGGSQDQSKTGNSETQKVAVAVDVTISPSKDSGVIVSQQQAKTYGLGGAI